MLGTFLSEASPLEAGSLIQPVADHCCTVVVDVVVAVDVVVVDAVAVVVAVVLYLSHLYHHCTGCHPGTSAGA